MTTSTSHTAKIWNTDNGKQVGNDLMHEAPVMDAAFSADNRMIVTGDSDGNLKFWNCETSKEIEINGANVVNPSPVSRLEFSPTNPNMLAVGRRDGTVVLSDLSILDRVGDFNLSSRIHSLGFDSSGRYLQASSQDGIVQIWDANEHTLASEPLPHDGSIRSSTFSPNGEFLLTSTRT